MAGPKKKHKRVWDTAVRTAENMQSVVDRIERITSDLPEGKEHDDIRLALESCVEMLRSTDRMLRREIARSKPEPKRVRDLLPVLGVAGSLLAGVSTTVDVALTTVQRGDIQEMRVQLEVARVEMDDALCEVGERAPIAHGLLLGNATNFPKGAEEYPRDEPMGQEFALEVTDGRVERNTELWIYPADRDTDHASLFGIIEDIRTQSSAATNGEPLPALGPENRSGVVVIHKTMDEGVVPAGMRFVTY